MVPARGEGPSQQGQKVASKRRNALGGTWATCTRLVTVFTGHLLLCSGSHVILWMSAVLGSTRSCSLPKRCILGLGVSSQSAVLRPDHDSLGVGCCKAVDGWTARKLAYNEHGHPTAQPPDWDFCAPSRHGTGRVKWRVLLQRV